MKAGLTSRRNRKGNQMTYILSRRLNIYADRDFLCGWSADYGTVCSPSKADAITFGDYIDGHNALVRAKALTPKFMDGRSITWQLENFFNGALVEFLA